MPMPVIQSAQMREWENDSWAAGRKQSDVIRRVGQLVARRAEQFTNTDEFILLLAGKGHNGDDVRASLGFFAHRRVELLTVTAPKDRFSVLEAALSRAPALIVDGLFGIGLNRALDETWVKFISRINAARVPVLAVDLPSGLDADTGQPRGAAIEARVTLTIGAPKQGLLSQSASVFVGRLEVAPDVGLIPCPFTAESNWTLPEDFHGFPPARPVASHKGSFGHLAIIAGSKGFHGAAVLATHAAQRAQPGLVTLYTNEPVYQPVAMQLQSAMVSTWSHDMHFPGKFSALLIGPGLATHDLPEELVIATRKLWRDSPLPVVVDASALDWLLMDQPPIKSIRIITPHPGEAARLLKTTVPRVQENRTHAVREISKHLGNCWVILKGHQTLIGRSTGEIFVNPSGNPHLAQGGSGDVLAGYIAGLMAQPKLQADSSRTLRYAVWQHGATADFLQRNTRNWIIEDLAAQIGNVI
jgi:NAD(P)H-hydrate epimerase